MTPDLDAIRRTVAALLAELPPGVTLVAAAKSRAPEEVLAAVEAGITVVGENYVQETQAAQAAVGQQCQWHFIGRLQKNKVKKAVLLFDLIQTLDSAETAREIDRRSAEAGKVMPVLIEINSGREPQKAGVFPERAAEVAAVVAGLKNVRLEGLMTMGPELGDPEGSRSYFRETKRLFDDLARAVLPNARMDVLSMGMSDSYRVAIEEGANMVRLGTRIFGPRS
jgi:pyridoxal phosphate enzyme (YggS family)